MGDDEARRQAAGDAEQRFAPQAAVGDEHFQSDRQQRQGGHPGQRTAQHAQPGHRNAGQGGGQPVLEQPHQFKFWREHRRLDVRAQ